jgi:hypothetical protein
MDAKTKAKSFCVNFLILSFRVSDFQYCDSNFKISLIELRVCLPSTGEDLALILSPTKISLIDA